MDSDYYRELARLLMTNAAKRDDPIASRLRERAQEYIAIAGALDRSPEANRPAARQQQQIQPKQGEDETAR